MQENRQLPVWGTEQTCELIKRQSEVDPLQEIDIELGETAQQMAILAGRMTVLRDRRAELVMQYVRWRRETQS